MTLHSKSRRRLDVTATSSSFSDSALASWFPAPTVWSLLFSCRSSLQYSRFFPQSITASSLYLLFVVSSLSSQLVMQNVSLPISSIFESATLSLPVLAPLRTKLLLECFLVFTVSTECELCVCVCNVLLSAWARRCQRNSTNRSGRASTLTSC